MAGTITTSVIQNDTSSPPTFRNNSVEIGTLCRAWVNFNGTGTVAIRGSFNVSSITDNGTGDYTVNFTTALPDANYAMQLSASPNASGNYSLQNSIFSQTNSPFRQAPTTTTARFITRNDSFAFTDPEYLCVSIFR